MAYSYENGFKGRLYKSVKNMYANVKARIRCGAKLILITRLY